MSEPKPPQFEVSKKRKWKKDVVKTYHATLGEALAEATRDRSAMKNSIICMRGYKPNEEVFFLHQIVK